MVKERLEIIKGTLKYTENTKHPNFIFVTAV